MNFLCRDMEALKDTSRPADRIRQDVNRSPGGDSEIFHTQCVGCHSGMDALAGAYAYFEWDAAQGRMVHTPGQVQGKYAINTGVFPGGHVTTDNSWINLWRTGQNAALGWNAAEPGSGLGAEGARRRGRAQPRVRGVPGAEGVRARLLPAAARRRGRRRDRARSRPSSSATGATTCARCSPTSRSTARRASSHGAPIAIAASALRRALAVLVRGEPLARVRRLQRQLEQRQRRPRPATASSTCRRRPAASRRSRPRSTRSCASTAPTCHEGNGPGSPHFAQPTCRRPIRRSPARAR